MLVLSRKHRESTDEYKSKLADNTLERYVATSVSDTSASSRKREPARTPVNIAPPPAYRYPRSFGP